MFKGDKKKTGINFALIGCGRIGQRHARLMAKNGTLKAVCDIVKDRADTLANAYAATPYYDIDELLHRQKDTDVIAVCTPNGLHAIHCIKILQTGMHVLCEKPMAITTADCRTMIHAANEAGKNLFVVKQNRFNPPVLAVKKLLDEKKLGRLYSIQLNCFWNRNPAYYKDSWRGTFTMDGGTLFTQFSHFIDLLYWLIGDVKNTQAILNNYAHRNIIEFEDTGVVILEFENGVSGSLHYTVNSHLKNMEGSLTIFAEKGTIKVGGQYLNRIDYQNIENYIIPDLPAGNPSNQYDDYQGSMSNHDKVYENLVKFLQKTEPLYMNSLEALKTVEIIEKIYSSARRNS